MKRAGLFWVFIITICIRVLFIVRSPNYVMTGDSISYYLTAKIITDSHTLVDPWRTPVYPLILALPYSIFGHQMPSEVFGVFQKELYAVRLFQSLLGIISAGLLYSLCVSLGLWIPLSIGISILATSDVMMLLLEHTLLTEAYALCLLAVVTHVMYVLIRIFSWKTFMFLVLLWILGVFIRPSLIALPILCTLVLLMRYRTLRMLSFMFIGLLVYGGSIFIYSRANGVANGYMGLSRISDVNIWGKLLLSGVTPESFPKTEIGELARKTFIPGSVDPWTIFRGYPQLFNREFVTPYHEFVRSLLFHSMPLFFVDTLRRIPTVVSFPTTILNNAAIAGFIDRFFFSVQLVYNILVYLTFIPLLSFPFVLIRALQKKSARLYILVFLIAVGWYHVGIASALAYEDFGRHMAMVRGILFMSLGILIVEGHRRWHEKN